MPSGAATALPRQTGRGDAQTHRRLHRPARQSRAIRAPLASEPLGGSATATARRRLATDHGCSGFQFNDGIAKTHATPNARGPRQRFRPRRGHRDLRRRRSTLIRHPTTSHDVNSAIRSVCYKAPCADTEHGLDVPSSERNRCLDSHPMERSIADSSTMCRSRICLQPPTRLRVCHGFSLSRTAHRAHTPLGFCPAGSHRESVSSVSSKNDVQANGHAPVKTSQHAQQALVTVTRYRWLRPRDTGHAVSMTNDGKTSWEKPHPNCVAAVAPEHRGGTGSDLGFLVNCSRVSELGVDKRVEMRPITLPSRAEPSRAEPSRAEPSRAEPSRAEPSRA